MSDGKKTMPSLRQMASVYSLSEYALRKAKGDGLDIYNKAKVRNHFLKAARRPNAWVNGCPWDEEKKPEKKKKPEAPADDPSKPSSKELDLIREIENADDYDEARTLKTKVDSLYKVRQMQIQDREYIHKDEVQEDMTRIGSGLKAGLLRLQADLPPMLEGLEANEMQKVIGNKMHEMLEQWANESSDLYTAAAVR